MSIYCILAQRITVATQSKRVEVSRSEEVAW